jgi:mono/diheme cytochrome c family protein
VGGRGGTYLTLGVKEKNRYMQKIYRTKVLNIVIKAPVARRGRVAVPGGLSGLYIPDRVKPIAIIAMLIAASVVLGACGSQGIAVSKTSPYYRGAVLFRDHCSGCHTLSVVGAEGSATSIKDRLKTNGPNFNIRKENVEQVLYAIRNGGFSGAIMPENIVLGDDAREVAAFLAHYSGSQSQSVPSTNITLSTK